MLPHFSKSNAPLLEFWRLKNEIEIIRKKFRVIKCLNFMRCIKSVGSLLIQYVELSTENF